MSCLDLCPILKVSHYIVHTFQNPFKKKIKTLLVLKISDEEFSACYLVYLRKQSLFYNLLLIVNMVQITVKFQVIFLKAGVSCPHTVWHKPSSCTGPLDSWLSMCFSSGPLIRSWYSYLHLLKSQKQWSQYYFCLA